MKPFAALCRSWWPAARVLPPARAVVLTATVAFAAAAVLTAAGTGVAAGVKGFKDITPPAMLPDVAVMTLTGEPTTLARALPTGKPAVVNLWAIWCPPCIKELPALARLQAALGDRAVVVALSEDRGGPKSVGEFIDKTGLKGLLVLTDPRAESLQELKARGLPTTLLLDAKHHEVARMEGDGDWDNPATVADVRARLGLGPPG